MDRLGIAFADGIGCYVTAAIYKKRPDINLTVLYEPEETVEAFLSGAEARMEEMGIENYLTVLSVDTETSRDYFRLIEAAPGELDLDLGGRGLDTRLLYFTLGDGLFQRSFALDILEAYLARIPGSTESVKLALPGYSYREADIRRRLEPEGIRVIDPLDAWLERAPKGGEGDLRFYWTRRNFPLERRLEEIMQYPVRFRTYYRHPWLRGEAKKTTP